MASLNKVMLIGNCTRDPEIRYTPKGTAVTELGLAVNRRYSADNGERREEVTFIDVTLWGKTAEVAAQYLKKGRPLFVEGRLRLDSWDDKQTGQKRSKLSVVGENIEFLGSRESGGGEGGGGGGYDREYSDEPPRQQSRPARPPQGQQGGGRPQGRPAQAPKPPVDPDLDVEGDDIPF
jgi:single-strand DNA-binding protein